MRPARPCSNGSSWSASQRCPGSRQSRRPFGRRWPKRASQNDGCAARARASFSVGFNNVSADYFSLLEIPIVRGRAFTRRRRDGRFDGRHRHGSDGAPAVAGPRSDRAEARDRRSARTSPSRSRSSASRGTRRSRADRRAHVELRVLPGDAAHTARAAAARRRAAATSRRRRPHSGRGCRARSGSRRARRAAGGESRCVRAVWRASSARSRRRSASSRWCSRPSASTASSHTPSAAACARSACASRSAPPRATS